MTKSVKTNFVITLFMLFFLAVFITNPAKYMSSTLRGMLVWANNVVPALFPFFVITKFITAINQKSSGIMDKFTCKVFNAPKQCGNIFALSILSGYPVGAMLISDLYKNQAISKNQAQSMFSFCSTSGPIFIVGTVGIGMFKNMQLGYILLLGHILGAVLNGVVHRPKKTKQTHFIITQKPVSLYQTMYDSILSILFVGGYIVISFLLIDMLNALQILPFIARVLSKVLFIKNTAIVQAVLSGAIEITRGCLDLSLLGLSARTLAMLAGGIIAFSGLCIFVQSLTFLNNIGIKKGKMLFYKFTQCLFTIILTCLISFIFL